MFVVLDFTSLKIEDWCRVTKLGMDLYLDRFSGRGADLLASKGIAQRERAPYLAPGLTRDSGWYTKY